MNDHVERTHIERIQKTLPLVKPPKPKKVVRQAVEGAKACEPVDMQRLTQDVAVLTADEWNDMTNEDRFEKMSSLMKAMIPSSVLRQDHLNWDDLKWSGNLWKGRGREHSADAHTHEISSISPNVYDLDEVHVVPAWKALGDGDDENPSAVAVADKSRRMMTSMHFTDEVSEEESRMRSDYYRAVTDGDAMISATMFMGPYGPIYKADNETAHAAQGASMGTPLMPIPILVARRFDLLSKGHPTSVHIGLPSDARSDDKNWYAQRNANMRKLGVYHILGADGAHIPHDSPLRCYPWMLDTPERVEAISKAYQEEYEEFGYVNGLEAAMLDADAWRSMWENKRGIFG